MKLRNVPFAGRATSFLNPLAQPLVAEPLLVKPKEYAPAMLVSSQSEPNFMITPVLEPDLDTEAGRLQFPLLNTLVPDVTRRAHLSARLLVNEPGIREIYGKT